jgi:hypothetical protein
MPGLRLPGCGPAHPRQPRAAPACQPGRARGTQAAETTMLARMPGPCRATATTAGKARKPGDEENLQPGGAPRPRLTSAGGQDAVWPRPPAGLPARPPQGRPRRILCCRRRAARTARHNVGTAPASAGRQAPSPPPGQRKTPGPARGASSRLERLRREIPRDLCLSGALQQGPQSATQVPDCLLSVGFRMRGRSGKGGPPCQRGAATFILAIIALSAFRPLLLPPSLRSRITAFRRP